jgi:putative transposase
MSDHIHKWHNKNLLLYHIVYPIKYRRSILTEQVNSSIILICSEIEIRYEIYFIEKGLDENHVHFLVQSVPMCCPKQIDKPYNNPFSNIFLI